MEPPVAEELPVICLPPPNHVWTALHPRIFIIMTMRLAGAERSFNAVIGSALLRLTQ
jgi:hypothetical protein